MARGAGFLGSPPKFRFFAARLAKNQNQTSVFAAGPIRKRPNNPIL
jgi:hypothetical protein